MCDKINGGTVIFIIFLNVLLTDFSSIRERIFENKSLCTRTHTYTNTHDSLSQPTAGHRSNQACVKHPGFPQPSSGHHRQSYVDRWSGGQKSVTHTAFCQHVLYCRSVEN